MPTVFVTLVTWNARADVVACLESVRTSTLRPAHVLVIDNASTDGTADAARAAAGVEVVANDANLGYAAAQNVGIRRAIDRGDDYVLFLTPDVVLAPDHIATLVRALEGAPPSACAGGKLLRPDGKIDSAGIHGARNRHFTDRGQGESDDGRFDDGRGVFAPCGAVVLHRVDALRDVAVDDEFLDESFFAYKEDIDLAWRYHWAGWTVLYESDAIATHGRAAPFSAATGAAASEPRSVREIGRDRAHVAPVVRRLSARNQLLLLAKNEPWSTLLTLDGLRVAGRQLAVFAYALLREPSTLPAYLGFLRHLPGALRRRRRMVRRIPSARSRDLFR